ncbi:hydantoin utilization protein A [Nocardia nova SH22a]|uniref:Hydantoin utilization protein A n=1 Tax=Nocardia nova SH22a TaxID=1415166 RepID=W5TEA9_9NOCA|nr:hydantoinase/oxoprolinase family protein [Nocardia nova]AHH17562.1 hydantoin utilization protein A [Nocardia nova SH22a]
MSEETTVQRYRIGVDVGGTFTDAVLVDTKDGVIRRGKVRTTPEDQSIGVFDAIESFGIGFDEISVFVHGNTVALNALLERKGPTTALICSEGARDMLDMGGLRRPDGDDLYDSAWIRPHQQRPLVHRRHVREVVGRLRYDGAEHVPVDPESVRAVAEFLKAEGVESIAVCLLHAYLNPEHEEQVRAIIADVAPEMYVQTSSVRPVVGEYDRTFSVILNAYSGPLLGRYLNRLAERMRDNGYPGRIMITQMNGGVRTLERTVAELPACAINSGPTSGLLGAEAYARMVGEPNFICVDIGGTSTDIGLVHEGRGRRTDDWELEFGIPLGFPALDTRSVGAGGGSLIHIDEHGTLQIGPESAGSEPGPACYGRGGTRPAITDALVALGFMQDELFLDGRMSLDRDAAVAALNTVAEPLGMTATELAAGVFDLMCAHIESECSKIIFEAAVDPSTFTLLAFGGAGPMFAARLAKMLGAKAALIPYFPGGFSALGMVSAPLHAERARSLVDRIDDIGVAKLREIFAELDEEVFERIEAQGVSRSSVRLERSLHAHYVGQGFTNRILLPAGELDEAAIERWKRQFHEFYERTYGYSALETPIQVTTMTVTGTGEVGDLPLPRLEPAGPEPDEAAVALRAEVCLDGRNTRKIQFFRRELLRPGNLIAGPAVIDDGLSTILVEPEMTATIDTIGNILLTPRTEGA